MPGLTLPAPAAVRFAFTATYNFPAPVSAVWNLLMDPAAMAGCLPGCRELVAVGGDQYQAELATGVAGSVEVTIALLDLVPPRSYRVNVEPIGTAGRPSGTASINLRPDAEGTAVVVEVEVEAEGFFAHLGQTLIEGVARTAMDGFHRCLAGRLGGPAGR